MKWNNTQKIKIILMAIISSIAFTFDLNVDFNIIPLTESNIVIVNVILNCLNKIKAVMGNYQFTDCFIFAGLLFFYWNTKQYVEKPRRFTFVPSILFSFFMVLGYSYLKIDSWDLVFGEPLRVLLALMIGAGYFFLFARMIDCVFWWFSQYRTYPKKSIETTLFFSKFKKKHPQLTYWIFILLAWSPYIIFRYPAAIATDGKHQIEQFLGLASFDAHHPPMQAFIMGACVFIGKAFNSYNLGLFIYILLQCAFLAYVFSSFIHYLENQHTPKFIRMMLCAFYAFVPLFPLWGTTAIKDTLYSAFFVLFILSVIKLLSQSQMTKKLLLTMGVSSLFVMLLRNNGVYIIVPTTIALILWKIYNKKDKREHVMFSIFIISPIVCYFLFTGIFLPFLNVKNPSISESFPVMIQQTGRYVYEYQEQVTQKEAKVISNVMDYENMAYNFIPNTADPIKKTWNNSASKEDVRNYFSVWFQQFLKHPGVYFEAAFNINYGFYYPGMENVLYYSYVDLFTNEDDIKLYNPKMLKNVSAAMVDVVHVLDKLPVYNIIMNSAIYYWIVIVMIAGILKRKNKKILIIYIPLIMNMLVCLVTPMCVNNARYAFPVMFVTPLLLGWLISFRKKEVIANEN